MEPIDKFLIIFLLLCNLSSTYFGGEVTDRKVEKVYDKLMVIEHKLDSVSKINAVKTLQNGK